MEISTARLRYDLSGIGRSQVITGPPCPDQAALSLVATCVLPALPLRGGGCHFELNRKAFVAAYTPSAMMMPVASNPSTAMKMATILDRFWVGRKSP